MKCPQCKMVEMVLEEVKGNKIRLKCRKCGYELNTQFKEDKTASKLEIKAIK